MLGSSPWRGWGEGCMHIDVVRWQTLHIQLPVLPSPILRVSESAVLTSVLNFDEEWTICPIEGEWAGRLSLTCPLLKVTMEGRGGGSRKTLVQILDLMLLCVFLFTIYIWRESSAIVMQTKLLTEELILRVLEEKLPASNNVDVNPHQTSDSEGNKNNKPVDFRFLNGWETVDFGIEQIWCVFGRNRYLHYLWGKILRMAYIIELVGKKTHIWRIEEILNIAPYETRSDIRYLLRQFCKSM